MEGMSSSIELESFSDISNLFYVIDESPAQGTLTENNNPVVDGIQLDGDTVVFTPNTGVFSSEFSPAAVFPFFVVDTFTAVSPLAFITVYVEYSDVVPVVPDNQTIRIVTGQNSLFTPVEIPSGRPAPITFNLLTLPPMSSGLLFYQGIGNYPLEPITGPTEIYRDLLIYTPSDPGVLYNITYEAVDGAGEVSNVGTVFLQASNSSELSFNRGFINLPQGASLRVDLADYVTYQGSETLQYYITQIPAQGSLYQLEDDLAGEPITVPGTKLLSGSKFLYVSETITIQPAYAMLEFTASTGNNIKNNAARQELTVNIILNRIPFVDTFRQYTPEDTPVTLFLNGTDTVDCLVDAIINSLPLRGRLYQFDDNAANNLGTQIAADPETGIFTRTPVTDLRGRVVFVPSQDENGTPYTSFTFLVYDGHLFSNLGFATIYVIAQPDLPTALDAVYTVEETTDSLIQLEAFDPEPIDDALLQYRITLSPTDGQLFQTDAFENPEDPILPPPDVVVEDNLARVIFRAPNVPVQFADGTQFVLPLQLQFEAFVDGTQSGTGVDQVSNLATIFINVLGVNNPPVTLSQSVVTIEDSVVEITLEGFDLDPEDSDLECYISTLPANGILSQWVEGGINATQFEVINTAPFPVTDPLYRVLYIPNPNEVGDPLDSFLFYYFDGRENSFSSVVTISVLCENDIPIAENLPENVKAEDGTDIVIFLGGRDIDSEDPKGLCEQEMGEFWAGVSVLPSDNSTLYQWIDQDDQTINDYFSTRGSMKDQWPFAYYINGTVPTKLLRGPQITEPGTIVTDPLNRVIFAAAFYSRDPEDVSSASSFDVFFADAFNRSEDVTITVDVRLLTGVQHSFSDIYSFLPYIVSMVATIPCLICVAVMVHYKNQKPVTESTEEEWDIEDAQGSDDDLEEMDLDLGFDIAEKPKGPLEELLLQDNLRVVTSLCDVVEVTEFDEVSAALVSVFEFHNETMYLIKKLITKEVNEASSAGTLFRSNSMASKVMTAYSKKIGHQYLMATLMTPLNHIQTKDISLEVDPRKLPPGEDRKANMKKLHLACQNFTDWIVTSASNAPLQFKDICYHLFTEVSARFPQSRHSAVGGFLFLRFFCPAVISPEGWKLIPDPPSVKVRRCLVLIAKALQNLSNGVLFGQKEQFMMDVNSFIEKNTEAITSFFEEMAKGVEGKAKTRPVDIDPEEMEESLNTLHRHLYLNREELCDVLNLNHGKGTATVLTDAASRMTEGLTTFLHTHSLGDATHLDTSDVSGFTHVGTIRGAAGGRSRMDRTLRSERHGRTAGPITEQNTMWDLGDNTETMNDGDEFTFDGDDSDLDNAGNILTEDIKLVPLGQEDDITEFDLSSTVPDDETETLDEESALLSDAFGGGPRGNRSNMSRGSSRRMSRHATMTATDLNDITFTGSDREKRRKHRRRSTAGNTQSQMSQSGNFEMAEFVVFGNEGNENNDQADEFGVILDEVEEDEYNDEHAVETLAQQLMKVLDQLGKPVGV
tara:strand:- start:3513 stop:8018 length:4506 start_codon:yes stop_codon:yes gene_type:complete